MLTTTVKVADDGRITLPKWIRDKLHIEVGEELAVTHDSCSITFTPNISRCYCCGTREDLAKYKGLILCRSCAKEFIKAKKIVRNILKDDNKN